MKTNEHIITDTVSNCELEQSKGKKHVSRHPAQKQNATLTSENQQEQNATLTETYKADSTTLQ